MRSFQSPILFLFSFLAFIACVGPFAHADSSNPSKEGHVIRERAANKTLYKPLYQKPSNSTPRFLNLTHKEVNPQRIAANAKHKVSPRSIDLFKRQSGPAGTGTCAPGTPCSNGACCSKSGFCGYSPDFCGSANCISNCGAKAECGQYAAAGKQKCPLNVCCSQYGFCGTTSEFCGTGCDSTGGGCGPAPKPSGGGGGLARSIGYYESWASTRPCDKVLPKDLDTSGFTHMNFAFAFFHPTSFQITPMDANAGSLLKSFTSLKESNPRLQTWISVGGWSFNDPGNNPDTRTAFSDMASSATNRATFISSLMAFMRNNGFDGVDIDWEYPAADDRGGKPADTANYVSLVKEMKAAFGRKYGLSVTLPASYWYLQHFDVKGMQPYVDWFNVMTYDIHGVWDSSNRFTGPYVRPHTNLTEIDDGLSLLWRAGVSASNVVMGLGFYGRSFKLASPSCSKPWCTFSSGATAGACTGASGILSLAEIGRTITKYSLTPSYDAKAAVKWISWSSDQWVSYDDEQTFKQKMDYARDLGLSGTMIWAVDQAALDFAGAGSSNDAYTGFGNIRKNTALSKADIQQYQNYADAQDSCYTSFCGKECAPGYSPDEYVTKGQVGELGAGSACKNGEVQQICCKTGTMLGRCAWYGWRGQGLSCYGGQCPQGDTLIAVNSNHYFKHPEVAFVEDQTCNGGSQIYCCRGFQPSMQLGRDADLLQTEDVESSDPETLQKRDFKTCTAAGIITGGTLAIGIGWIPALGPLASLAAGSIVTAACFLSENEAAARKLVGYSPPLTRGKSAALSAGIPGLSNPVPQGPKGGPKNPPNAGPKQYGRYALKTYPQGQSSCQVTYTCSYGQGFDQVCDNQKYGLDKITNPVTVFNYDQTGSGSGRTKARWAYSHNPRYRYSFAPGPGGGRYRCEIDEFPMNSLRESANFAQQALRAIDGGENGAQGQDFQFWLLAEWWPCSSLMKAPPPITWSIGSVGANDPRRTAANSKTIAKYGFDSVSGRSQCWATYTLSANGPETTVKDHGFRVGVDDPLFGGNWPRQNYSPLPAASAHPTDVASAAYVKKRWGVEEEWVFGDMQLPTKTVEAKVKEVETNKASSPAENCGTSVDELDVGTEEAKATITPAPDSGRAAHLHNHVKGYPYGHGRGDGH